MKAIELITEFTAEELEHMLHVIHFIHEVATIIL